MLLQEGSDPLGKGKIPKPRVKEDGLGRARAVLRVTKAGEAEEGVETPILLLARDRAGHRLVRSRPPHPCRGFTASIVGHPCWGWTTRDTRAAEGTCPQDGRTTRGRSQAPFNHAGVFGVFSAHLHVAARARVGNALEHAWVAAAKAGGGRAGSLPAAGRAGRPCPPLNRPRNQPEEIR